MTSSLTQSLPLENTFSLCILHNEWSSFAVFHYNAINWVDVPSAEAAAKPIMPQAGIFFPPKGIQLPRSGLPTTPHQWISETNTALDGEWIFPLFQTEIDISAAHIDQAISINQQYLNLNASEGQCAA
ncbi:hypothetical protein Ciccas_013425 [Cichlidogyrus casuarinus]|uniref:Uncharacterized protein n=1 Tax=Cichlidogyrus casuarinus TaxID=1844966 RepID=A0ABD2PLE2_9PLAT